MRANYHTHTWRCMHAKGTEKEYVEQALNHGLEILGFSDHGPWFYPGGYVSTFRMLPEQLQDYVQTVLNLKQAYAGRLEIHLGLEQEYYPGLLPGILPVLRDQPIEYLLLGQHLLGDEVGEHYNGRPTDSEELLRRYCNQVMEGMNTGLFTYLAHPDLFWFTGSEKTYRRYMTQLCREAKSCGMPLEINLLGLSENRQYPNAAFWKIAAEENCPVVIGVDAHTPQSFGDKQALEKGMEIVSRYGLELLETVTFRPI